MKLGNLKPSATALNFHRTLHFGRASQVAVTMLFCGISQGQNLFQNNGFENNSGGTGQGLMPDDWMILSVTPDTYTNDGSFGLSPSVLGNFTNVLAKEGIAWVAGWSGGPESFGQVLATPMVAGSTYRLSGWMHQALRSDLNHEGGYLVHLLDSSFSFVGGLGTLGSTEPFASGWVQRSFTFVAPVTTDPVQVIRFVPYDVGAGDSYPGLDDVHLELVPEPASSIAVGAGLVAFLRRRRA